MENNIKNTAFEWYIEQHNIFAKLFDNLSPEERFNRIQDIVTQTKEMEKKQIIDACLSGDDDGVRYYKKTYGNNNHK